MSSLQWRDWSCTVRVVLADGCDHARPPQAADAAVVSGVVRSLMAEVEAAVSRFRRGTDLDRVHARPGVLVPVRPLTLTLVQHALTAAAETGGACDPTVGGHVVAAGYDDDIDAVRARPDDTVTAAPAGRPADWTAVRVDRELGRVGVPAALRLDLGATAKAWTADEAAGRLSASLGVPALVSVGGDVAVAGGGPAWPVLVSEHEGGTGDVVALAGGGLATSSTRGRRWRTAAGEQHHVIDPATGRPAAGPYRTVSVRAGSCLRANMLSTAALVWGAAAPERLGDTAARLVHADGTVVTTGDWTSGRLGAVAS